MKKLLKFLDNQILKIGVLLTVIFTALYPKLPSIYITHTWVYVRLEDFLIGVVVLIWLVQLIRKKVSLPFPISIPIFLYWFVGFLSLMYSIIFIGPHLANFFPKIATLEYLRRIEYMILFFVAFSTIRTRKDLRDYLVILGVTLAGVILYALGQKYYLSIWATYPDFARRFPFCFPSFQTGNEEFAKGIPLCLPSDARITSTFGGHYDLAAYLVVTIPVLITITIMVKKIGVRIATGILSVAAVMVLIFTASRISFVAYIVGITCTLIFLKKKKFILPIFLISVFLLLMFSSSLAKRFMETIRFTSIVTNNQGQVIGEAPSSLPSDLQKKIASGSALQENVPTQNLPVGSSFLTLPSEHTPTTTNVAVVKTSLTAEQIKELKLKNGGVEISTISGSFLVQKALVYDISFTTRFQGEWPHAWAAFMSNPPLGTGYSSITLASDNDYLRALGESGFLGLASFLFIFIFLGIYVKETSPSIKNPLERGFIYGMVGGVIGLFINASLIDVFEASKVGEPLWILLGLAAGTIYLYPTKSVDYMGDLKVLFKSKFFIAFYLFILLLIFFIPSINNFFVSTDFVALRHAAASTLSVIQKSFIHPTGSFYRPIETTVMYFLLTFFSFYPQGYHLFIILFHFLMSFGVYLLALRLFKKKLPSFIGSVLFLLLPAHQDNVFWLSAIGIDIASVCILYSVISYLKFRNLATKYSYATSICFFIIALFVNEIAVMLPFLILLSEYFVPMQVKKGIRNFLYTVPYLLLVLTYLVFRYFTHSPLDRGISYLVPKVIPNFFDYIALFIYGHSYTTLAKVIAGLGFLAAVIILWLIFRKQEEIKGKKLIHYPVIYGLVFILITLLPVLNQSEIFAYNAYLASVGFILLIIYLFYITEVYLRLYTHRFARPIILICALVLTILFINMTDSASQRWQTAGAITYKTLSIFKVDYDNIPKNAVIYLVNVPLEENSVPVFDKGLNDSLWFIYRDNSRKLIMVNSVDEARQAELLNPQGQSQYILKFDDTGNVEEVK